MIWKNFIYPWIWISKKPQGKVEIFMAICSDGKGRQLSSIALVCCHQCFGANAAPSRAEAWS